MLHGTSCNKHKKWLKVDGAWAEFSLANEGTKVCIHALHALLGLITNSWETMVASQILDSFAVKETSFLTSAPSFQRQTSPRGRTLTGYGIVDTESTLPNNPAFNSFLASLSPRLMNAYLVTRVVQCRSKPCA